MNGSYENGSADTERLIHVYDTCSHLLQKLCEKYAQSILSIFTTRVLGP